MRIRLAAIVAGAIVLLAATAAHARSVEFYVGGGGGYEWFDLSALAYDDLLSLEAVDLSGNNVTYNPPIDKYKGHSFIYDAYAGVKLGPFVLAVDYRGSHTMETIGFNQLSGEFTFLIPTKKVFPFFRIGVGYVWMTVKVDKSAADPDLGSIANHLRARGLGARAGAGLDVRLVKFFSFGVGVDVGFLYFSNKSGKSWGLCTDVLGRLTFHI